MAQDYEYEDIVRNICNNCGPCLASDTEQNLVQQWIAKLDTENYSDDARWNRNDYARYLEHMVIERKNLHYPFVLPPPVEGLKSLQEALSEQSGALQRGRASHAPCPERKIIEPQGGSHSTTSATASIAVYQPTQPDKENVLDCNRETLRRIIAELGSHMSLPQFVGLVSPHTCDRGSVLRRVMGEEQVSFRDFVERMFAARNTDVGDLLAREQTTLKDRYDMWKQRMENRQVQSEAMLREVVPDFDWEQYTSDPFYLDKLVASQHEKQEGSIAKAESSFQDWKRQMMNRLSFMRDQMRDVQRDNEAFVSQLHELRSEHHERQTMETMNEQMLHEKNSSLYSKLRELQQRREQQQQSIDVLFQQIEACQCLKATEQ